MIMAMRKSQEERPPEQPVHVAQRIANTILDCLFEKNSWSVADLRAANFSYDDLARYLPEACKIVEEHPRPSQR